jgi:hypothetical protein
MVANSSGPGKSGATPIAIWGDRGRTCSNKMVRSSQSLTAVLAIFILIRMFGAYVDFCCSWKQETFHNINQQWFVLNTLGNQWRGTKVRCYASNLRSFACQRVPSSLNLTPTRYLQDCCTATPQRSWSAGRFRMASCGPGPTPAARWRFGGPGILGPNVLYVTLRRGEGVGCFVSFLYGEWW